MLWQEVKQAKKNNASWVSLQNVMRRIIEYYFRILGGFKHNDSLSECFENIEEKNECVILSFHGLMMALMGFQMICLCKVKIQVLRHI